VTNAVAVIPTKSNFTGLHNIVSILREDPAVERIIVVAHGPMAFSRLQPIYQSHSVKVSLQYGQIDDGIHDMWNIGLNEAEELGCHALFINDDVESDPDTASLLCDALDKNLGLGLLCPNYDGRASALSFEHVTTTCGARYDGTGGLAGFYMALHKDLVPDFEFDTRMKWYYGDDDILKWTLSRGQSAAIMSTTHCWGNKSKTINSDPPPNFAEDTENDRLIYELKWGTK
jgi:hypothetical protein